MLGFRKLPGQPEDWDTLIAAYDTKTLFHESAWLRHVLSIHPDGRIDYFEISDGSDIVGYHCCLAVRKFGIPVHGSPLGGTGTNFMGPLVSKEVDQRELVRGLLRLLSPLKYWHMELSHFWLQPETVIEAGFRLREKVTHLIPLPNSEDEAWSNLKSTARNRIRKAENNGLIVEETADPEVVRHFYEQFIEVYGKQGMVTPFGQDRAQSLFDCLLPRGRVLPVWVRFKDEVLAAGLFPYDDSCIYFWGAASWLRRQSLNPNELLQWFVIKRAVQMGISAYNMCGGASRFKDKFGGSDVPYFVYNKSAVPGLGLARDWYRKRHFNRLKKS